MKIRGNKITNSLVKFNFPSLTSRFEMIFLNKGRLGECWDVFSEVDEWLL